MTPTQLTQFLRFAIKNRYPVMIKGKPGTGKTDIVTDACEPENFISPRVLSKKTDIVVDAAKFLGARLLVSYPVTSDPTDAKGLPWIDKDGKKATFLPFGDLAELLTAETDTVYFMDDLGQAPATVQASYMNLILGRRINGQRISDKVTFIAATNRREDKAAVSGILEPVKSRFSSIIELEVSTDDWVKWALSPKGNMPTELIAFIRFRPQLLENFQPTKDIVNTSTPRTVANVGKMQNDSLPKALEMEAFTGAAGEAFAAEYCGFLEVYRNLPDIDQIILNPDRAKVPVEPQILYALAGALGHKMNEQNIGAIITYLNRLDAQEIAVVAVKDAITRDEKLSQTRQFINWASDKTGLVL